MFKNRKMKKVFLVLALVNLLLFVFVKNVSAENITVGFTETGSNPKSIAVNSITNKAYILSESVDNNQFASSIIVVVDLLTNKPLTTISIPGDFPSSIALNYNTNKIYEDTFTESSPGTIDVLKVIEGISNQVSSTVRITPESPQALVPSTAGPPTLAVNSITNKIYVIQGGGVLVIDGKTNSIISTIQLSEGINLIAVNETTNKIYATNHRNFSVSVIDGSNDTVLSTVSLDSCPGNCFLTGIGINSSTNKIYLAGEPNNRISSLYAIDGSKDNLENKVVIFPQPVDDLIDRVLINPNANKIYISDLSGNLSVIDGSTNNLINTLEVGLDSVNDLAFNISTNKIYGLIDGMFFIVDTVSDSSNNVNPISHKNSSLEAINDLDKSLKDLRKYSKALGSHDKFNLLQQVKQVINKSSKDCSKDFVNIETKLFNKLTKLYPTNKSTNKDLAKCTKDKVCNDLLQKIVEDRTLIENASKNVKANPSKDSICN